MSDPRNVAHDKKIAQVKKHKGGGANMEDAPPVQPGKKPHSAKKTPPAELAPDPNNAAASESAEPAASPMSSPPATLEGSRVVLAQLKEMAFHARASLDRLAELTLTVEDKLKQKELVGPLGEVYSAQAEFHDKLTTFIAAYEAECERIQGQTVV